MLIEYKGDFVTPEELAERLDISDFEIVNEVEPSWFEKLLEEMDQEKQ